MMARMATAAGALVALSATHAFAQDEEAAPDEAPAEEAGPEEAAPEEAAPEEAAPEEAAADEAAAEEAPMEGEAAEPAAVNPDQADAVADAQAGDSAAELPGKTYRFVGARYRGIIVPKFILNLFADGGKTVYVHSFGPEFAFRKDGFEYNLGLWFGLYNMDETPFKGKDDDVRAWELVKAENTVMYLTSDFLWSQEFSPEFSLNYGLGAGFGFVFGDLHRNQALPPGGVATGDLPDGLVKCESELQAPDAQDFCDTDNDHYGDYTEPNWANGGSKPLLFPWLVLQTGLRYKASRRFVTRLDLGFGTSGFFFGIGADYGL